jgi:transcription antitermination factor NusG
LFPGYFFASFCPILSFDAVRYVPGVLRVVGPAHLPTPILPEIISDIKERVQLDGFIHLESNPFRPGDEVRIEQGPFAGWMAEVEQEWNDGKRVAIFLGALQQARLLIQRRWLQLAETG